MRIKKFVRTTQWGLLYSGMYMAAACANMSTLQTGRALPAGEGRILIGGGYYTSPDVNEDASSILGEESDLTFPYAEIGYRRGIIENLELGAKVTIPGTIALDGKYQFVDAGGFALAAGVGAGYLSISSGEGDNEISSTVIDLMVPIYASYHIGDYVALYTSPKYALRVLAGDSSGTSHLVGGTGGVKVGNTIGVFFEGTYMKDLASDFDAVQVNGSFFF